MALSLIGIVLLVASSLVADDAVGPEARVGEKEKITSLSSGLRLHFPASSLVNWRCQPGQEGIECYFPDRLMPVKVVSTPERPAHVGAWVRGTMDYSASWQGWVDGVTANATTPVFSFFVIARNRGQIVGAVRKSVTLSEFREQKVHTKATIGDGDYGYVLAKAEHQRVSVDIHALVEDVDFLTYELDLS